MQIHGKPPRLAIVIAALLAPLSLMIGGAHAATTASNPAPQLTTNTNAGCNTSVPPGYARCLAVVRTPADHRITPDAAGPPAGALGPADIQSAYKLPTAGAGQTVAIVDAFGDSSAEQDLAKFRAQYGLSPCTTANGCFRKVDQAGGTNYPPDDSGWGLETSLDLDAVSSACPKCNILLVQGNTPTVDDLSAAVKEAVKLGAKYISNSYGSGEDPSLTPLDSAYVHSGVAVIASSGDTGDAVLWPSSIPDVTAAGGTTLTKDGTVSRGWTETAWGDATGGEGGGSGCSVIEPKPAYQAPLHTDCQKRATADVAAVADPSTGLGVYDTLGYAGWLQVGGTSLASPLIAAMHALAGAPTAGTYPVATMYHDTHLSHDIFDITKGSNGPCGNVLCNAGNGWDGPTGLGTPDGIGAFASGPQGQVAGTVTDAKTGKPVAGATVTASPGSYLTHTDAAGKYALDVAAGTYSLTAVKYAFKASSDTGVKVAANGSATAAFSLTELPHATVSGTVTDGSGHGWPLYAAITIDGYPGGTVYTNPFTGRYSVLLATSSNYNVHVVSAAPAVLTAAGGGYQQLNTHFSVGTNGATHNFAITVDKAACTALGYGPAGLSESFTGWSGKTPAKGWTITGTGWRFDNPGDRPPPSITAGDDSFAIADSATEGALNTTLTSPPVDLAGQPHPVLTFDSGYYGAAGQHAQVGLSTDGGRTWTSVWSRATSDAVGTVMIELPQAAGKSRVQVRFHYAGTASGWWWSVDQVSVGTPGCTALPGGLLEGRVSGASAPLTGATVASAADPSVYTLSTSSDQPALFAGYYELFSPLAGQRTFTVSASGYTSVTKSLAITSSHITRHDWSLSAAGH